jgi:hypothetical protein
VPALRGVGRNFVNPSHARRRRSSAFGQHDLTGVHRVADQRECLPAVPLHAAPFSGKDNGSSQDQVLIEIYYRKTLLKSITRKSFCINILFNACIFPATSVCNPNDLDDCHPKNKYLDIRRQKVENSTATNTNTIPQNTDQKSAVMKEICSKWSKFSEKDVFAMKGKADLVSQVVTKYGLPQIQAQSEVDALLKGRQIGAGA